MSYYPPGPGYPPGYPPPPPPRPRTNGLAVASMVLGVAGITVGLCLLFFPIMPILAVIFGHIGLSQVRATGAPGNGYAISGLVTGYIGIGLAVLWIIAIVLGTVSAPTPTF